MVGSFGLKDPYLILDSPLDLSLFAELIQLLFLALSHGFQILVIALQCQTLTFQVFVGI